MKKVIVKRVVLATMFISLLLVCSCKNKNTRFVIDVHEIDFVNMSELTIQGVAVDASLPLGIRGIIVCDSMIVLLSQNNLAQVTVYNTKWQLLGDFCSIGRARNEFISPPFLMSNQFFKRNDGHILIPLIEGRQGIKVVDITQSLTAGSTVIASQKDHDTYEIIEFEDNGQKVRLKNDVHCIYLDNDIDHTFQWYHPIMYKGETVGESTYLIRHDTIQIKSMKVLADFNTDDFYYYQGVLYKNPEHNIIIQPFSWMDYIIFFDLDNDKIFAIHQSGSLSFDNQLPAIGLNEKTDNNGKTFYQSTRIPHFGDASCTSSYFITLYSAGDYSTNTLSNKDRLLPELLIFNWNGKFLKSVKLDTSIDKIAFDEKMKILYGLDVTEDRLYKFDLSNVL